MTGVPGLPLPVLPGMPLPKPRGGARVDQHVRTMTEALEHHPKRGGDS